MRTTIHRFLLSSVLFVLSFSSLLATTITKTVGASGADYSTLKGAFDKINDGTLTGDVVLQIIDNTTETDSVVLNASGSGSASYTSVTIYPTVTGKKIGGDLSDPLIQLNGAKNVVIDGRVNASGSTKDLTIENTRIAASVSTIRFINGASSNTVKYCTIKGSSTGTNGGTFSLSTSTSAGGNNSNVIEHNNITNAGGNRALCSLISSGTTGKNNDGNIVRYNNFYDCFTGVNNNYGVFISSNTSTMTVSYNSFYETTTVAAEASSSSGSIRITNNINTTHTISYNYIGGSSAECVGKWTKTTNNSSYRGIWVTANSGTVNITNNTIKNFDWTNSANGSWYGILANVAGVIASDNTIGGASESIKLTNASTDGNLYGIFGRGTFSSNTINGLWTSNGATLATRVYGIYLTQAAQVNGNMITNLYANSASTGHAQTVAGIWQSTADAFTVYDNTISVLENKTTRTSNTNAIVGIYFRGSPTLADNYSARNFIHSFTGAGAGQRHYGIRIVDGDATHYNNIVSIGGTTGTVIYGIYDTGGSMHDQYLYFNTVYIHGTPSGTASSFALYSNGSSNVRNYRNNLLVNARTTNGSHYAAFFNYSTNTNLTLDYNDYYVSGTGGVLGRYNSANVTSLPIVPSNDANSLNLDPDFIGAMPSTTTNDYKISSPTWLKGISLNPTITTDYTLITPREDPPSMGAFEATFIVSNATKTVGATGADYATLKAAFDAINDGFLAGNLELQIIDNTTETETAVLNASGSGSASYTYVNIYPTVTGKKIGGSLSGALIQLDGADNVTIDGRLNATGSTKDLTIENSNTGTDAKTIEFINGSSSNTVKYGTIQGSSTGTGGGTVRFSTSTAAGGNNSNIILYNNITKAGSNRALISLISLGTVEKDNDGNSVRLNSFFDCYTGLEDNHSVSLRGNTSNMIISDNSFYETTPVEATGSSTSNSSIHVDNTINTTHTVSNNYIGGNAPECSGTWTKTTLNPEYKAIWVVSNSGTVDITDNTIKNFNWTNSANASWFGIRADVAGVIASDNTIGGASESIKLANATNTGTAGTGLIGIYGKGTFSSNTINGLWTSNGATLATNVYGICLTQAAQVNGNMITNLYANSASTGHAQTVAGIWQSTANELKVYDNTISNLTNNSTGINATIDGIYFRGSSTLENNYSARNFIHSFTGAGTGQTHYGIRIAGGNATHYNNIISIGGTTQSEIYGIQDNGGAGDDQNLYFNTVYIHGTPSGTVNSAAFRSNGNANIRNIRNNLFVNARSTNGSHYAVYFFYGTNTDLTLDYNDYYVSGTGGVLGYYNSTNVTSLPIVTENDANSLNVTANFTNAGGIQNLDYQNDESIKGVAGTGITTDYNNSSRPDPPSMGAWPLVPSTWDGATWSHGVPFAGGDAIIDGTYNGEGFTCKNLTVNAGKTFTLASGTLTVQGNLTLESSSAGTATFINGGGTLDLQNPLTTEVQLYLPDRRNWYISSPVTGAVAPAGYTYYWYREPIDNWASTFKNA